jgi:hypothetical protein
MISEKRRKHIERLAKIRRGTKFSKLHREKISIARKKFTGSIASNWKGGKFINGGYIYIYSPNHPNKTSDGYVCEHRLVMERKIGRYLDKTEVVHHINHNKSDNRLKNLHLFSSSAEHTIKEHLKRDIKTGRFLKNEI